MILLAITSCLLFFITYFTGILTIHFLKRFFKTQTNTNFFETFILGLITSFVYFSLVSFFLPVNYVALFPPLLASVFVFTKRQARNHFFSQIRKTGIFFFSGNNIFFSVPFLLLLLFFWVVPPLNWDSAEYHYIAIRWYEQFKVIPGLGNVHGRLAFNPASFIISAAYSFTDLTGQSLYPLNGVLTVLFYIWLLKKTLTPPFLFYNFFLFIVTILMFRITLINISSPSSDMLSGLLIFYCGFRTYELVKSGRIELGDYLPVIIMCCFSITAKLSAVPSLLILPFIYFFILKKDKSFGVFLKISLLATLILLPWLARNFLLSGYLLYPVPASNIFVTDWAVPKDVIRLDYLFSKYGPRTITVDFVTMQKMNLWQLTIVWWQYLYKNSIFSLLISLAALASPAAWLLFRAIQKHITLKIFLLWCIYYLAVWAWFINSPEHRFGLAYLVLAIFLPALELLGNTPLKWKIYLPAITLLNCFLCLHYAIDISKRDSFYFSLNDCLVKPLRDYNYYSGNDLKTFPFINLGNNVKLYLPDSRHSCLNAPGPCMNWRYGNIEMRGKKIEDGFRNTKDEVNKYYPFIHP